MTSVNTIVLLVLSHHINKTVVVFIDENLPFHNPVTSIIILFHFYVSFMAELFTI